MQAVMTAKQFTLKWRFAKKTVLREDRVAAKAKRKGNDAKKGINGRRKDMTVFFSIWILSVSFQ